ncbi:MAG: glycosyltransferase [Nitrosospira multiformis]|nr:glycosyltransferase [Nitrosospira multiformis]
MFTHSIWLNKLLRELYKNLPLPWYFKHRLKDIYLRRPGAWNALTRNVFQFDRNPDALPSVAANACQYDPAQRWILVVGSSVLSTDEDNDAYPMLAILHLLREMGFHITFVPDSSELLREGVLEKQGIHLLHGLDAVPLHLRTEGGKYHHVLLYGTVTSFRHLPYVRAYAPYSRVIYWMANSQPTVRPDPVFPDPSTELHRFELFNTACADLVLVVADDKEKDNLFVVQPETKIALVPGFPTLHSDDKIRKQWANIFSSPGASLLDWSVGNNEAKLPVFSGGGEHNSTASGSAI